MCASFEPSCSNQQIDAGDEHVKSTIRRIELSKLLEKFVLGVALDDDRNTKNKRNEKLIKLLRSRTHYDGLLENSIHQENIVKSVFSAVAKAVVGSGNSGGAK